MFPYKSEKKIFVKQEEESWGREKEPLIRADRIKTIFMELFLEEEDRRKL